MTNRQQKLFQILKAFRASLRQRRKQLGQAKRSVEEAILDALIAAFVQDAFEQFTRTRDLERLQQEKNTLTAELKGSNPSLLGTATQLTLLAALRTVERQRQVHQLRRVAATAALALHEQAARAFVRVFNRTLVARGDGGRRLAST